MKGSALFAYKAKIYSEKEIQYFDEITCLVYSPSKHIMGIQDLQTFRKLPLVLKWLNTHSPSKNMFWLQHQEWNITNKFSNKSHLDGGFVTLIQYIFYLLEREFLINKLLRVIQTPKRALE